MNLLKKSAIILAILSLSLFSACGGSEKSSDSAEQSGGSEAEDNEELFSFKFTVNGEEYTIPAPYEDFAAKGWEFTGEPDEKVPAHKYLIGGYIEKDEMEPSVYFMNDTDDSVKVTESYISRIGFDKFDMENAEIKYGDNIIMGKSTIEEVKAAFGEPNSEYKNEEQKFTSIDYQKDVYIKVSFNFDESGVLNSLELTNQPDL